MPTIDIPAPLYNKLLEELSKCKTELKSTIEASETRLGLKIEALNHKIKTLEKENSDLRVKLETLDRSQRRNNLVIFGLGTRSEYSVDSICNKLNSYLGTSLTEHDLNDAYPLGRSDRCPVKLEFASHIKKKLVLQNCRKLKGTAVSISQDLTEIQREEAKVLRKHLQKIRRTTTERSYIRGRGIYVDNKYYTLNQLEDLEESDEVFTKEHPNSAPPTPSASRQVSPEEDPLQQGKIVETESVPGTATNETPKNVIIKLTNKQRSFLKMKTRSNK